MKTIIAMAGQMGSGKDTSADYLVERYGFVKLAFADNLKQMAMSVFELKREDCYDEVAKFKEFRDPAELELFHLDRILKWVTQVNGFEVSTEMVFMLSKFIGQKFKTPRHILQFLGTEILRETIHTDYHTEVLKKKIDLQGWDKVVISDCRFPNEREKVKQWEGKTVLVTGRNTNQNADSTSKSHASENSLGVPAEYNFVVENVGTIETLHRNLDWIVENLHN